MTADTRYCVMRIAVPALLAAALAGCASIEAEPLATKRLQQDANDPRIGIVVLRFKTEGLPPDGTPLHDLLTKGRSLLEPWLHWGFAVANESTGWSFRPLDEPGQVFRTRNDSLDRDPKNLQTGWVTFLAPPGTSYVAVTPGRFLVAPTVTTRSPDRISVQYTATMPTQGLADGPRITVQVQDPREISYAGTVVAALTCTEEKPYRCPYEITLADETEAARSFVSRYLNHLAAASPMRTRLFTIPQSRTVTIRERSASAD